VLSASETKEKRPDERPINELLTPALTDISANTDRCWHVQITHFALWLSCNNGAPIKDRRSLRAVISATTLAAVGVAVSPHLFRTCAASTAAMLAARTLISPRASAPYASRRYQHALQPGGQSERCGEFPTSRSAVSEKTISRLRFRRRMVAERRFS